MFNEYEARPNKYIIIVKGLKFKAPQEQARANRDWDNQLNQYPFINSLLDL